MKHRNLRIAWSVACGIAAVLLVALWMRSYWVEDFCEWSSQSKNYGVFSDNGRLSLQRAEFIAMQFDFQYGEISASEGMNSSTAPSAFGASLNAWESGWFASISYAWGLPILGVAAMCPWFPWSKRLGLRSLLIATTLVAVGLGAVAYFAH